jgi:hypothetical protein
VIARFDPDWPPARPRALNVGAPPAAPPRASARPRGNRCPRPSRIERAAAELDRLVLVADEDINRRHLRAVGPWLPSPPSPSLSLASSLTADRPSGETHRSRIGLSGDFARAAATAGSKRLRSSLPPPQRARASAHVPTRLAPHEPRESWRTRRERPHRPANAGIGTSAADVLRPLPSQARPRRAVCFCSSGEHGGPR